MCSVQCFPGGYSLRLAFGSFFYEAFGLVVFVAFGVFVAFMGHWSWTLVAFSTVLAMFMGRWGWTFVVFYNFLFIYLFI